MSIIPIPMDGQDLTPSLWEQSLDDDMRHFPAFAPVYTSRNPHLIPPSACEGSPANPTIRP